MPWLTAASGSAAISPAEAEAFCGGSLMACGALVLDLALETPVSAPLHLFSHVMISGWESGLHLTIDPRSGVCLGHRQGGVQGEIRLPIVDGFRTGNLRLTYVWDAPARQCRLTLEAQDGSEGLSATGFDPFPVSAAEILALAGRSLLAQIHPAVTWLGITSAPVLPGNATAVGANTPILTPRGFVRAADLGVGDLVRTADHGDQPLCRKTGHVLPGGGSLAPVRLRAPFYSNLGDLVVSPGQQVLLSGASVEYHFGEEEVAVPARALVNGHTALLETRRETVPVVALACERAEVLFAGNCPIACQEPGARPARRALKAFEAASLRTGRSRTHGTAA